MADPLATPTPVTSDDTAAARLDRLELAEEARSLAARYARACDARDLAELESLFAPDAVLETPHRSLTGRDEVLGFYRDALSGEVAQRHFLTNQEVEHVSPGVVRLRSYFLYTSAGAATSLLGWGTYDDVVERRDGAAVLVRKAIEVLSSNDVRTGWATS
jgi:3-phenylpropionate/cinnamic acid dioxygenase small subunit